MEAIDADDGNQPSHRGKKLSIPVRWILAVMGFFGYCLLNSMRLNLSMTIVAMVNATAVYGLYKAEEQNDTILYEKSKDGEFVWDPQTQGIVLGALYWTLSVGNLIGGRVTEIFGSKRTFVLGMLIYSVLTLATPLAAGHNWHTLAIVRALAGFFQGIIFPAFGPLIRRWFPSRERGLAISTVYGGLHFGSFFGTILPGYLCGSEFIGGWPSVYYIFGIVGCLWCLIFQFVVYETPSEHPWISEKELHCILTSDQIQSQAKSLPVPWKSICLSPAVWGFLCSAFSIRWAQFHFYTVHPTYMATISKYSIQENGVLSSLPHLLVLVVVIVVGSISDIIRRRKCMSVTLTHKSSVTIGILGYIICIVGVIEAGYDIKWNTSLLIIAMGFTGIAFVGESIIPLDMSPNFSGSIIGLAGFVSTTAGYIIPAIVGALTKKEQTMAQWKILFYISIAITGLCTLAFDIIGSAEPQPWDPVEVKIPRISQSPQNSRVNMEVPEEAEKLGFDLG